jgi:hypothetical protein
MNKAGVFLHESICLGSKPEYSEVMVKYRKNIENQLDIDFDNSVVIYSRRKGEKSRDISNYGRNGSEWSEYLPLLNYIISKKLHIILVGDKSKQCIKYFKDIINSNLLIGNSGDIEDYQKFTMLATSNAKFYIGDQGGNNLIRALFRKKSLVINGFYGTEVLPFSFFAFKKIIDNSTEIKKGSYRNDESSKFATLASHNSIEILAFFQFYMDNINTIGLMDQDVSVVKDKLFLNNSTSRLIEYTSKGKVIFK